jgi:hypothetical protein
LQSLPSERKSLIEQHSYIQLFSLLLATLGFLIVYFHKTFQFKPHFNSTHSLTGLGSLLLTLLNTILGILLKYGYVKKDIKKYHVIIAYTNVYFGLFTLLLGLFTSYFLNRIWKVLLIFPFSFLLGIVVLISYPLIYSKKE